MSEKLVFLKYIKEIDGYAISQNEIIELKEKNITADIRLPEELTEHTSKTAPTLGFLLGQDTTQDGTKYYSISQNYTKAMLNTGAKIRFLDYEQPCEQMTFCHGFVLPGGNFDFPKDYFISGKDLGTGLGKRFFAYKSIIEKAYQEQKPMLGICAGAQMLGAVLGKMKMYTYLKDEIDHPDKHKPTEHGEICMHDLRLVKGTPIFKIMEIPENQEKIAMNSRHAQAMVHSNLQDYTKIKPIVQMDIYALSDKDDVPEIWGNEEYNILCIQGHPEDMAASGNKNMQNLYNYIAKHAAAYKQKRS